MSFVDDINIYNDPILASKRKGTVDDPYKQMAETLTVENNGKVLLTEIPNTKQRVIVKNGASYLMEANDNASLDTTMFSVDYPNGIVYFHSSLANQSLDFTYLGEGARFFPASRIWLENDTNNILNAKDKFSDIDNLINEQKSRVDTLITSNPQPSEVVDMRIDRNGIVYTVAKDRIDAEQLKIDNLLTEIDAAHVDKNNTSYLTLKERLDAEQLIIESANQEITDAHTDANNNTFTSLKDRFNLVEGNVSSLTQNITSMQTDLTLKLDASTYTGQDIVSKIELTPSNILISADKINLNGAIGINALDSSIQDVVNNAVKKSMINFTGNLPTALALDTNGITAYTSDTTKYARLNASGLYVKGGAITVERPDGFQIINTGMASFNFEVMAHEPPYKSNGVNESGAFYQTQNTGTSYCNYYTFKHVARYLNFGLSIACDAGTSYQAYILDANNNNTTLWWTQASHTLVENFYIQAQVDLGTPTGSMRNVYLGLSVNDPTKSAFIRVLSKWLEG